MQGLTRRCSWWREANTDRMTNVVWRGLADFLQHRLIQGVIRTWLPATNRQSRGTLNLQVRKNRPSLQLRSKSRTRNSTRFREASAIGHRWIRRGPRPWPLITRLVLKPRPVEGTTHDFEVWCGWHSCQLRAHPMLNPIVRSDHSRFQNTCRPLGRATQKIRAQTRRHMGPQHWLRTTGPAGMEVASIRNDPDCQ